MGLPPGDGWAKLPGSTPRTTDLVQRARWPPRLPGDTANSSNVLADGGLLAVPTCAPSNLRVNLIAVQRLASPTPMRCAVTVSGSRQARPTSSSSSIRARRADSWARAGNGGGAAFANWGTLRQRSRATARGRLSPTHCSKRSERPTPGPQRRMLSAGMRKLHASSRACSTGSGHCSTLIPTGGPTCLSASTDSRPSRGHASVFGGVSISATTKAIASSSV